MPSPPARLRGLFHNLLVGARLVLFMRVAREDFRATPAQLAALFAFNLLVWLAGAFARNGYPGAIDSSAVPILLLQVPFVLLAAIVAARIYAHPDRLVVLAIAWIAGDWVFELVVTLLHFAGIGVLDGLIPGWIDPYLTPLLLIWAFAALVRALVVVHGGARPMLWKGIGVVAALQATFLLIVPHVELWVPTDPTAQVDAPQRARVIDEEIFHQQPLLLARAGAKLAPERRGVTDLYFLGVAAYASQNVFVNEATAVRRVFEERFDAKDRSLLLVNSATTLTEHPIATVTNLRAALGLLAEQMNKDEDVLVLFLTSHGESNHEIVFEMPPLALQQLTPTALARMIGASGIRWKVLVLSACYSGGFVEALKDANTIVMTAADATSTSFGCEHGRDWTYFGEAMFRDALPGARSILEAFDSAKSAIAARESREGLTPSNPQLHVGDAIRAKLGELEARLQPR